VSVHEPKGMFGQVIEALREVLSDLLGASAQTAEEVAWRRSWRQGDRPHPAVLTGLNL